MESGNVVLAMLLIEAPRGVPVESSVWTEGSVVRCPPSFPFLLLHRQPSRLLFLSTTSTAIVTSRKSSTPLAGGMLLSSLPTHQQSTSPPTPIPPPLPFRAHLLSLVAIKVLGPLADRRLKGRDLCLGWAEPSRRGRTGGGGGHHAKQKAGYGRMVESKACLWSSLLFCEALGGRRPPCAWW